MTQAYVWAGVVVCKPLAAPPHYSTVTPTVIPERNGMPNTEHSTNFRCCFKNVILPVELRPNLFEMTQTGIRTVSSAVPRGAETIPKNKEKSAF